MSNYGSDNLSGLGVRGGVRAKPASVGLESHNHPFVEILGNSIDEAGEGFGSKIEIRYHEDGSVSIKDYGRGVPMSKNSKGEWGYKKVFDELWAGGKYTNNEIDAGEQNYKYSLGTNGVGATATNYTSDYMIVIVERDGHKYHVEYKEGLEQSFNIETTSSKQTSTLIRWKPSAECFRGKGEIDLDFILEVLESQAVVNGGISFEFYNEKTGEEKVFYYEDGITTFLEKITPEQQALSPVYHFHHEAKGRDNSENEEEHNFEYWIKADVFFRFTSTTEYIRYYHNTSLLENGGTPDEFLRMSFVSVIDKLLKERGLYQKKEKKITYDDIRESLIIVTSTYSTISVFSDQTKKKIQSDFMKREITATLREYLEVMFAEDEKLTNAVLKQLLVNKRSRERSEKTKSDVKKKLSAPVNNITARVDGFENCRSTNVNEKELYIVEGKSALGSTKQGRDDKTQAVYAIRGKTLNVEKKTLEEVLSNDVLINIIKLIGVGVSVRSGKARKLGLSFDLSKRQFSKIIISTDADEDGFHIRMLLLTALRKLVPELFDEGMIYIAESPLFEIVDKSDKSYFAHSIRERDEILEKLGSNVLMIQRSKGLGENTAEMMWETTMNPETRTLIRVTPDAADKMDEMFDLFMGEDVISRRNYIIENLQSYLLVETEEKIKGVTDKKATVVMQDNFMPYAAYVILHRALPEIDGFKVSQRRILYTMYKMGLLKGARRKSQGVVGNTMAIHPHGDSSIYEALVRMSADNESLLLPYVDSKGNFGKTYLRDMDFAGARYTEARLMPIAKELFRDIDKGAAEIVPSFDGEASEPLLLPVAFPSILVNPQKGIAVGMATEILGYNFEEIMKYAVAYIRSKGQVSVHDYIKAPDFSTGGQIIINQSDAKSLIEKGEGSIMMKAKYHLEGNNTIVFTEIPNSETYEKIIERIIALIKEGKLKEVVDYHDRTGVKRSGLEITVRKGVDREKLVQKLYALTTLQTTLRGSFKILVDGKPVTLGVEEALREWLKFRLKVKRNVLKNKLSSLKEDIEKLEGFKNVLDEIERVVSIIKSSNDDTDTLNSLMSEFGLSELQAKSLLNVQLRSLNKENILVRISKLDALKSDAKNIIHKLKNNHLIMEDIAVELEEIEKKYPSPRRASIIEEERISVNKIEVEPDYNIRLFVTQEGYVKKVPAVSLRGVSTHRLKEGDSISYEVDTTNNTGEILVFTNMNNVYKIYASDLTSHKLSDLGTYVGSAVSMQKEEAISSIIPVANFKEVLLVGFKNGKMGKISLDAYKTKTKRTMLKGALSELSEVVFIYLLPEGEDVDVLAKTAQTNKAVLLNTSILNPKSSRNSSGGNFMKTTEGDSVTYTVTNGEEHYEKYRRKNPSLGQKFTD